MAESTRAKWQYAYCAFYCNKESNEFEYGRARRFLDSLAVRFRKETGGEYLFVDDWNEMPGEHKIRNPVNIIKKSRFVLVVYSESCSDDVFDDVLHHKAFKEKVKSAAFIPITIDGSSSSIEAVASMTQPLIFHADFENDEKQWKRTLQLLTKAENLKDVSRGEVRDDRTVSDKAVLLAVERKEQEGIRQPPVLDVQFVHTSTQISAKTRKNIDNYFFSLFLHHHEML